MHKVKTEDLPKYGPQHNEDDDDQINEALRRLSLRLTRFGANMTSPNDVKNFCVLQLADRPHEVFCALFLNSQHQQIVFDEMFRGTLTQTSVYPREVVKRALELNASAVILVHNHPSGSANPSRADEVLTAALKQALALVDVRVLDHIIVGGMTTVSFAERGLL